MDTGLRTLPHAEPVKIEVKSFEAATRDIDIDGQKAMRIASISRVSKSETKSLESSIHILKIDF